MPDFPDDFGPDDFDQDDGDFDDFDCGMGPDGLCMNVGTEWCDFDCPMRDTFDLQ